MHAEVWDWLVERTKQFVDQPIRVLELGSRIINGTPRTLPTLDHCTSYLGIDVEPGKGVDLIADAADVIFAKKFHLIVCTEVLEHTPRWDELVENAARHLLREGTLLLTAACDPRTPHSGTDGGELRENEYYENIDPDFLDSLLSGLGFSDYTIETHDRGDVYAVGVK